MPRLYRPAPGCAFPESYRKMDLIRHLRNKTNCACKAAGWTAERALDPASVTRQTSVSRASAGPSHPVTAPAQAVPPVLHALTAADGRPVMRTSDGYVNATRMCQAAHKCWPDFSRLAGSRELLTALSTNMSIPMLEMLVRWLTAGRSSTRHV